MPERGKTEPKQVNFCTRKDGIKVHTNYSQFRKETKPLHITFAPQENASEGKKEAEWSIEEKVLLLRVTSGSALMVQVNSGAITGAGCGEGESRLCFIKGWGRGQRRWYRGGAEIRRTVEAEGENVLCEHEGGGGGGGGWGGGGGGFFFFFSDKSGGRGAGRGQEEEEEEEEVRGVFFFFSR